MNKTHYLNILLIALLSNNAHSGNVENSLNVSASLESKCFISISNLNFGELLFSKTGDTFTINNQSGGYAVIASSDLKMMCNKNLPISYSFSGSNSNSDYILSPVDYDGSTKRAFAMKNKNSNVFYHFITNFNSQVSFNGYPVSPNSDFAHYIDGSISFTEIFNPEYNTRTVKALIAPIINPYFPTSGEYSDIITMTLDF